MQPGGASLCKSIQISPNSSKEICFYFLGFVWTSLAESGFFNELRGKKLKKLRFYRRLYLGDSSRLPRYLSDRSAPFASAHADPRSIGDPVRHRRE
jgi:hypothetical protein